MSSFINFFITLLCFIFLDCVWLGFIMKPVYQKQLGILLRTHNTFSLLHGIAAIAVWILIVLGVYIFVIPMIKYTSYTHAFLYGIFFGGILYGVYELTNLVVLAEWPLALIVIDIGWGMFACGIITILLKKLLH